jgi:hypothetical protein
MSKQCYKHSITDDTTVFKKLSDYTYYVNSPCLLTVPPKTIQINGIYLKAEGSHFDPIQILNFHFERSFMYLLVKDLKTGRIYRISHIVGDNYPCIWWLMSWDFFENEMIKKIKESYKENCLPEFNFETDN